VPVISSFLGVVVTMYHTDHAPPHFHARHGSYVVSVEIETGVVHGRMPRAILRDIQKWRKLRVVELRANWARARNEEELLPIKPLP
jgi:hypothetical protein